MSTDTRRSRQRAAAAPSRRRPFGGAFALVAGLLLAVGLGGAALTTVQGPRVTDVQVNPATAIEASGSRVIFTLSQAVAAIDPEQVTVTPETAFTVDTSGRSIGIRFALPLWDATDYTIRIDGVEGVGGGTVSTLEESFTTPALHSYVLLRGGEDGEDRIFRTDFEATAAVPVFSDPRIEDYRASGEHLVVNTTDDDGLSHVTVVGLDGEDPAELTLPGEGRVTNLQVADRGSRIGYTFTDADVGTAGAQESILYTASADDPDADPLAVEREGEARVEDWRFVPGTDDVLMMTFDGALTMAAPGGAAPVALGTAVHIHGISPGSTLALIDTTEGLIGLDLATGEQEELLPTDPTLGFVSTVTPLPGGSGASLRALSGADGSTSTSVVVVDDAGTREVFAAAVGDALVHTCVSPSGRYAAFLVAPNVVDNPYDGYLLPLPETLQTHIVSLEDGDDIVALTGFDISWCETAPPL
ncbi:hypothetical protein [Microbacterium sp. bgisy189]|uniref:hypothetical protein n=1 Tax=Microbacterium sp. bgisy189 TaxID=3413798 RepID=UPI003EB79702